MIWGLVPAKLGTDAKGRLAEALPPSTRTALARAMLRRVLTALRDSDRLAGVAVVTRDEAAAALARATGARPLPEPGAGGLNGAVAAGVAACGRLGATSVLVAMGDLPLLTGSDVRRLVDALPERGLALAPSRDGRGTNLLAVRPIDALPRTRFGPESRARHRLEAARLGLDLRELALPGAALDVDTPADLAALLDLAPDALAAAAAPAPPAGE